MYEYHVGFNDFNMELNVLEVNINFTNPMSTWDYKVYGINILNADFDKLRNLETPINAIATDFQSNCKHYFDKTWQYAVSGGFGHTFYDCPVLQDADQIKWVYICLWVTLSQFFNSV